MEESDIIDLEKRYWLLKAQSRTGRFDLETFGPLVSPPIRPSLSEGRNHSIFYICSLVNIPGPISYLKPIHFNSRKPSSYMFAGLMEWGKMNGN